MTSPSRRPGVTQQLRLLKHGLRGLRHSAGAERPSSLRQKWVRWAAHQSPFRRNPILARFVSGVGTMSYRIAVTSWRIDSSWPLTRLSSWSNFAPSSLCAKANSRSLTKARTTNRLTSTACGELRMVAAMMAPCSVKTYGRKRMFLFDAVAFCDLKPPPPHPSAET